MKQYIFTGLLALIVALLFGRTIYQFGYSNGFREGFTPLEVAEPKEQLPDKTDFKTESEAWEATKIFVAASVENGHTATFGGKRAVDVVERTGNGSFGIQAIVYTQDADGEITGRRFTCRMTSIDGGKWHGVLTFTEDRKVEPKPSGEVI